MAPKSRVLARIALACVLGLAAGSATAQGRTFAAEGSDTIMGVGARHVAMGGTGAATADDPHAVFFNASLLADIDRFTVTGTRQLDGTLRPYTFIGAAVPLTFLEPLGFDATFGVARYNRVHARSNGAYGANEFESIFLRYLLPGISGTFKGRIDSKTLVNRFALGLRHEDLPQLSLGANVDWIDCKTNSCGVHAGSNGYETGSVHATALSYGVSASYRVTDDLTFGASYTDISTTLKVRTVITDNLGRRVRMDHAKLPSQLKLEAAYRLNDRLLFAAGYQRFWGTYGSYDLNFETAHGGVEFVQNDWLTWRAGAWMPLDIEASHGVSMDLPPVPIPSAGMGLRWGGIEADLSLYAHPMMTMHERFPALSSDLTLTYRF
jgi:opacity protein-like surface antigen